MESKRLHFLQAGDAAVKVAKELSRTDTLPHYNCAACYMQAAATFSVAAAIEGLNDTLKAGLEAASQEN